MTRAHQRGRHQPGARRAPSKLWNASTLGALTAALLVTTGMVVAGSALRSSSQATVEITAPQTAKSEPGRAGVAREAKPTLLEPRVLDLGTGRFKMARTVGSSTGPDPLRYSVEVEGGLDVAPAKFAQLVDATLADSRGWRGVADHEFERVAAGAEVRVLLATPDTVDVLCAPLQTEGEVSCRNQDRVVINAKRWFFGAERFNRPLRAYRRYVINHEVGHALGYPHQVCAGADQPAPVMLQQTLGLEGCKPNPWPVAGPPQ